MEKSVRPDLRGKTVKIKDHARHNQYPDFGGSNIRIEGYWDDLHNGESWMDAEGNQACIVYAIRAGSSGLPVDNEVLYGHREDGLGSLVHISELELPE